MAFQGVATILIALILVFIFSGCSLIRIGPPVEILEVNRGENADKILEA